MSYRKNGSCFPNRFNDDTYLLILVLSKLILVWKKIEKKIIKIKLKVFCSVVYYLLCNGHFSRESNKCANLKIDRYDLITRNIQGNYQSIRSYSPNCRNVISKIKFSDRITELSNRMTYDKTLCLLIFDLGGIKQRVYNLIFEN